MRSARTIAALFALWPTLAQDAQTPASEASGTDPLVLRIDGEEIRRRTFEDWLLRIYGERRARAYAELFVLREKYGARPVETYREEAVKEFQVRIDGAFGGDRAMFVQELERLGRSYAGRLAERMLELEYIALTELLGSVLEFHESLEVEVLPPLLPDAFEMELGSEVEVLRIRWEEGERVARRDAFAAWLRVLYGERAIARFAESLRVRKAARNAGLAATEKEVRERVELDIQARIDHMHFGDREAWLKVLARAGRTEEQYRRGRILRTRSDLLIDKLLRSERTVTRDELVRAWEEKFGSGGVLHEVRWIRIDPDLEDDPEREPQESRRLREAALKQAQELAAELRKRIGDGEDFATLVEEYSDDDSTRLSGGRPDARFRLGRLAEPFQGPVEALAPGELSPPLTHAGAVYLFEKTAIHRTPLAEVETQLRRELLERRPDEVEIAQKKNELTRGLGIEVLEALFR